MVRISSSVTAHRRKKRLLKKAKGYFAHRSKHYRQAKKTVIRAMRYATRDRKVRKREIKSLWIIRLNAACRELGITYSRFMNGLTAAKVSINRKMLADIAVTSPETFKKLVAVSQNAVPAKKAKKA